MIRRFRTALVIALCAHASVAIAFVRSRSGSAAPVPASFAPKEHEVSLVDSPAAEEAEPATTTTSTTTSKAAATRAFGPGKQVGSAHAALPMATATGTATATESTVVASVALVREAGPVLDLPSAVVPDRASAPPHAATAIEKGQRVRAVLGSRGARLSFRVESLVRQGAGNAVAPSVRVGTPLYRCMEACTASGNIDPSDAILNAASRPERFVDVRALSSTRLD